MYIVIRIICNDLIKEISKHLEYNKLRTISNIVSITEPNDKFELLEYLNM